MTVRPRILFVDDDDAVLRGLRLVMRSRRDRWDMEFVASGAAALAALRDGRPCAVVVSDLRMPGMDGATLLAAVAGEFPAAARLVLSGYADPAQLERAREVAHALLAKPCPPDELQHAIEAVLPAG
jgi:CheY-like chemotaxis protein